MKSIRRKSFVRFLKEEGVYYEYLSCCLWYNPNFYDWFNSICENSSSYRSIIDYSFNWSECNNNFGYSIPWDRLNSKFRDYVDNHKIRY